MANAIVIYRGEAKVNSWPRWMVGRTTRQNKNNLVAIVGPTGSGKTWVGIVSAQIISKMNGVPFGIDNIVFSLKELMDLINSGTLQKGSCIVFDEPQVSISAREFQSQANKIFNYLLSTFRHRNFTLFFCTPFENLLDKNTRKLIHCRFETMSINRTNNTCRVKPRFVEYSDFKDKPYRKQLIVFFKGKNGVNQSRKLFYWDVPKPTDDIIEQYEQKKREFTDRLNLNITKRLKKFDESGSSITAKNEVDMTTRRPLTDRQREVMEVTANVTASNRLETAGKQLGISIASVHENINRARKKGYFLEEFEDEIE